MKSQSRLVRIFISSTFLDFLGERDQLVRRVFPELRKLCKERQVELLEVDLRWGITEEQRRRRETIRICLEEIDRCRPSAPVFFIGMLGERYGWVPSAGDFPEEVLENPETKWVGDRRGHQSVTELEILHAVLRSPGMSARAFFYFRKAGYEKRHWASIHAAHPGLTPAVFTNAGDPDPVAASRKLRELKRQICESGLVYAPQEYETPADLAALVLKDLGRQLDAAFPAGTVPDELERQRNEHEIFGQSQFMGYVLRHGLFERLDAVLGPAGSPVRVVTGASGSGKSALLANWLRHARGRLPERCFVHYTGGTPESSTGAGLVRRLMETIRRWGAVDRPVPDHPSEAARLLPKWLALAAGDGRTPVLLVLDALNQMEDPTDQGLGWLPRDLPPGVRLVASTLPGRAEDALRARGWMEAGCVLEVPLLNRAERREVIRRYLTVFKKELEESIVERLAGAPQTGNPLFLRVVLEELRLRALHEALGPMVDQLLQAEDPVQLFVQVLKGLQEFDAERPHLVRDALGYLHAARRGLTENELLQLLSDHPEPASHPLPRRLWSPLYLALGDALVSREGRLGFFHAYLRDAVEREYLDEEWERRRIHGRLGEVARSWQTERFSPSLRAYGLAFGAYHLRCEGSHETLWNLLADEAFREAQKSEFQRSDEAVEALRQGVEVYARRNGATSEDDARLCWLTLRCGQLAREARTRLAQVFDSFRTQPLDDPDRIRTALERLSILDDPRFVDACFLLLYLEARRSAEPARHSLETRCERIWASLESRLTSLLAAFSDEAREENGPRCDRWIAVVLLQHFPRRARRLFKSRVHVAECPNGSGVGRRPCSDKEAFTSALLEASLAQGDLRAAVAAARGWEGFLALAVHLAGADPRRAGEHAGKALQLLRGDARAAARVGRDLACAGLMDAARKAFARGLHTSRRTGRDAGALAEIALGMHSAGLTADAGRVLSWALARSASLTRSLKAHGSLDEECHAATLLVLRVVGAAQKMGCLEAVHPMREALGALLSSAKHSDFQPASSENAGQWNLDRWLALATEACMLGLSDFTTRVLDELKSVHPPAGEAGNIAALLALNGSPEDALEILGGIAPGRLIGETEWDSFGGGHDYRAVAAAEIFKVLYKSGDREGAAALAKDEGLEGKWAWLGTLRTLAHWHANRGEADQAAQTFIRLLEADPQDALPAGTLASGILGFVAGGGNAGLKEILTGVPRGSICRWSGEEAALAWLENQAARRGNWDLLLPLNRLRERPDGDVQLQALEHRLEQGDFYGAMRCLDGASRTVRNEGWAALSVHRDLLTRDQTEEDALLYWGECLMEEHLDEEFDIGEEDERFHRALRQAKRGNFAAVRVEAARSTRQQGEFYRLLVVRLAGRGRFACAERAITCLSAGKTQFPLWLALAEVASRRGRPGLARRALRKAGSADLLGGPGRVTDLVDLARRHAEAGMAGRAVCLLDQALVGIGARGLRRSETGGTWAVGFLSSLGKHRRAAQWARLHGRRDRAVALTAVGRAAHGAGRINEARRLARHAAVLVVGTRDVGALLDAAEFMVEAGCCEDAVRTARRAKRLLMPELAAVEQTGAVDGHGGLASHARLLSVLGRAGDRPAFEAGLEKLAGLLRKDLDGEDLDGALFEAVEVLGALAKAGPSWLRSDLETRVRNRIRLVQDEDGSDAMAQMGKWLCGSGLTELGQLAFLRAAELVGGLLAQEWQEIPDEWRDLFGAWLDSLEPDESLISAVRTLHGKCGQLMWPATGSALLARLMCGVDPRTGRVRRDAPGLPRLQNWIRLLHTIDPADPEAGRALGLLLMASHALAGDGEAMERMRLACVEFGLALASPNRSPKRPRLLEGEVVEFVLQPGVQFRFLPCPPGEFAVQATSGAICSGAGTEMVVRMTEPFWILDAPLNRGQMDALNGRWQADSAQRKAQSVFVPWSGALELAEKLNRSMPLTGWRFAIPTEAQWEHGCSNRRSREEEWCSDLFFVARMGGENPHRTLENGFIPDPDAWMSGDEECFGNRVLRGGGRADRGSHAGTVHARRSQTGSGDKACLRLVLVRRKEVPNLTALLEIADPTTHDWDSTRRSYLKTARAVSRHWGAEHPETLKALRLLFLLICRRTRHCGSDIYLMVNFLSKILARLHAILGPEHSYTLGCMGDLGRLLARQSNGWGLKWLRPGAKALWKAGGCKLMEDALAGCNRVLGAGHPQTFSILVGLYSALVKGGNAVEAEAVLFDWRARGGYLEGFKNRFGGVFAGMVQPLLQLVMAAPGPLPLSVAEAVLGWDAAKFETALRLLHGYVNARDRRLRLFHVSLWDWLGREEAGIFRIDPEPGREVLREFLWKCLEKSAEADSLVRREVEREDLVPNWLPQMLPRMERREDWARLSRLAALLEEKHRDDAAEVLWRRVFEGRAQALGAEHPETLASMCRLGHVLYQRDDLGSINLLHRRLLEVCKGALDLVNLESGGKARRWVTELAHWASLEHGVASGGDPIDRLAEALDGAAFALTALQMARNPETARGLKERYLGWQPGAPDRDLSPEELDTLWDRLWSGPWPP